ncbi:MAG: hypothetical protein JNK87_23475 [Bryobacterales bacterium]|nr:hypothetical protein [Bryobacterales bacterium]
MKSICVLYATREGHTAKVAKYFAQALTERGLQVDLFEVRDFPFPLGFYDAAVLAASVHAGHHEMEMVRFVREHRRELDTMHAAFLSITLSEAGVERSDATAEEHAGFVNDVQMMLDRFYDETGWHPQHVKPVAGALLYTRYNFLVKLMMRRIARQAGGSTDTSHDVEYTNWADLASYAAELAAEWAQDPVLQAN